MCEGVCVWLVGIIDFIIEMSHVSPYYRLRLKPQNRIKDMRSQELYSLLLIVILFSRNFWLSSLCSVETVIVQRIKGVSTWLQTFANGRNFGFTAFRRFWHYISKYTVTFKTIWLINKLSDVKIETLCRISNTDVRPCLLSRRH